MDGGNGLVLCWFELASGGLDLLFFVRRSLWDFLADAGEEATQDVDVFAGGIGAMEQGVHAAHHALAVAVAEGADLLHGAFKVVNQALCLLVGGGVVALNQVGHGVVGLAEDFVAHDLYGLG